MKIAFKVAHYIGCCFTSGYFHVLNADGSYLSSVEIPVWESPVWSPDGKKIVFGSTSQVGTSDIYVMNADGTNPVLLTNQEVSNGNPVWSPDSTKIAFDSSRDGNSEIYVINADGSNLVRLTDNDANDYAPAWSP
jgi:Tol biopolymer transport system component